LRNEISSNETKSAFVLQDCPLHTPNLKLYNQAVLELSIKKKKMASEQFSEKKNVHRFPEKKKKSLGLRSSVGNVKPKCESLSVIEGIMRSNSN